MVLPIVNEKTLRFLFLKQASNNRVSRSHDDSTLELPKRCQSDDRYTIFHGNFIYIYNSVSLEILERFLTKLTLTRSCVLYRIINFSLHFNFFVGSSSVKRVKLRHSFIRKKKKKKKKERENTATLHIDRYIRKYEEKINIEVKTKRSFRWT